MNQVTNMQPLWQIWDDLIFFASTSISQQIVQNQEREEDFNKRLGRYDKATQVLFEEMFGEIMLAFEQEGFVDVLGGVYMQLDLSNHWKGQCFTPDHVCQMMAMITFEDKTEQIKQRGYVSVMDPTCGGGAMLIAYAKVCRDREMDYQHDVLFIGQDIDPVVARMCHISMSLLGMAGLVRIGNSLTMEIHEVLYTPTFFTRKFHERMRDKVPDEEGCTDSAPEPKPSEADDTDGDISDERHIIVPTPVPASAYYIHDSNQLSLFMS
jgi:hypothetical protein